MAAVAIGTTPTPASPPVGNRSRNALSAPATVARYTGLASTRIEAPDAAATASSTSGSVGRPSRPSADSWDSSTSRPPPPRSSAATATARVRDEADSPACTTTTLMSSASPPGAPHAKPPPPPAWSGLTRPPDVVLGPVQQQVDHHRGPARLVHGPEPAA